MQKNNRSSSSFLNKQQRFVYVCIVILFFLAGCGKQSTDTTSDASNKNEQDKGAIARRWHRTQSFEKEAQGIYRGNTSFTVAFVGVYASIDPCKAVDSESLLLANALFPRLTTIDPRTGVAKPSLAVSWQPLEMDKGFTYVFTLRNAMWDDGTPITAQNVRQSMLRIMDPRHKSMYGAVLSHAIKGGENLYTAIANTSPLQLETLAQQVQVLVIDEHTLHITVTSPEIQLLKMLAHPAAGILRITSFLDVSPSLLRLDMDSWIGGGAYTLSKKKDTILTMTARKQFWGTPWVKNIIVMMGIKQESLQNGFEHGQYDWVPYPFASPKLKSISNQTNDTAVQSTNTRESLPNDNDTVPASQLLFQEYIEHLPKQVQHSYFSSLVLLDIPEQSILHIAPTHADVGIKTNAVLQTSMSNIGYRLLNTFVVNLLAKLFDSVKDTTQWKVAHSIFLPHMVLFDNEQPAFLQSQVGVAQAERAAERASAAKNDGANTPQDDETSINTNNPLSFESIASRVDYGTVLQKSLQRQRQARASREQRSANTGISDEVFVLRIAFDHEILRPIAQVLYDYFQSYGISVALVNILSMEVFSDIPVPYDIAIRLVTPIIDTPMAMLTTMWFDATKTPYNDHTIQNFDIRKMSKDFQTIGKGRVYYQTLYNWDISLQDHMRHIPLWYVTHRERINIKKFRWWSPQQALWHPLFSW